jgi:hypothetical protein
LKTPPFPLTLPRFSSRETSAHLVLHARVEQVDHRRRVARELRVVLGVELLACRVHVGRVDGVVHSARVRLRLAERIVGRRQHLGIDLVLDLLEVGGRRVSLFDEPGRIRRERIARGLGFTLCVGAVHHLVV